MARKRIEQELVELEHSKPDWLEFTVYELFNWGITLDGPPNTPYEFGKFQLSIIFNKRSKSKFEVLT